MNDSQKAKACLQQIVELFKEGYIPQALAIATVPLQTPRTTSKWGEGIGAPQRPPEIFGVVWYWYDDPSMAPALATLP